MNKIPFSFTKYVYQFLAALGIVLAITYILNPGQPYLTLQIIILVYLLPIMLITVIWGLATGLFASVIAFLAFNYFFLEPFHTFRVHATQDLITLFIFLIVAVVMSQLIGRARIETRKAQSRELEATQMYELTSGLAGLQDANSIAEKLTDSTLATFNCLFVETIIFSENGKGELVISKPGQTKPSGILQTNFPLLTARGKEGELRIWRQKTGFSTRELRLLEAFTSQGALALERIRLTKGENKARVLEESDRLKTSLLNSVSHELRSPLAAIKASVSSLRSGNIDWDSTARTDLLETIEEETDHLNLLVGNLLDMSRIESGALKPNLRWNSIDEIVSGVVVKMRKQLTGHSLINNLDDSLPPALTDYVLMEQVFTNLLSNSIKYAPPDTTIQIFGTLEGDKIHILVTNEGPMVPEEQLERIFDKFNRITQADRITGTGLGLSICKGIVEAHNGKIWAKNQEKGFAFHILLPAKTSHSIQEPLESNYGG
jgi:two-component system, OmpR family, sensor histidine kinase KdpD